MSPCTFLLSIYLQTFFTFLWIHEYGNNNCGLTFTWNFFHIPQYFRHLHFFMLCIVSKCATLPQTNAESLWSLSVFGCSTLSGLHSLQNRYCSGQRGNRLLLLKHNQRFTARWKPSTLLWLNLPPFTACLPSSFRKPSFSCELSTRCYEYLLSHFCSSHCSQIIDYQELVSQYPTAKLS